MSSLFGVWDGAPAKIDIGALQTYKSVTVIMCFFVFLFHSLLFHFRFWRIKINI